MAKISKAFNHFSGFRTKYSHFFLIGYWFIFLIPSIRWNFDLNHETVLLNSVIAVKKGMLLHEDIFEPKGILYPIILGNLQSLVPLPISIAEYTRLQQYVMVGLIAFMVWWLLQSNAKKFQLLLPIFWISCNQYWTDNKFGLNRLFWLEANYLVTFLVILYIFLLQLQNKYVGKISVKKVFFFCGLIIGCFPWVRIQGIALFVLLLIHLIYLSRKQKFNILFPIIGSVISLVGPLIYIIQKGAMHAWINQIFIHPYLYSRAGSSHSTMPIGQLLTTIGLFTMSATALIFIIYLSSLLKLRIKNGVFMPFYFFILLLVFYWIAQNFQVNSQINNSIRNWIIILLDYFPQLIPRTTLVLTLLTTALAIVLHLRRRKIIWEYDQDSGLLLTLGVVTWGSAVFLYPNIGHTFILCLPSVMFVLVLLERFERKKVFSSVYLKAIEPTKGLFIALAYFSIVMLSMSGNQIKFPYDTKVLSGVYSNSKSNVEYSKNFELFTDSLNGKKALLYCNGIIPFDSQLHFISSSAYFMMGDNMQFAPLKQAKSERAVLCSSTPKAGQYSKTLDLLNLGDKKDWKFEKTIKFSENIYGTVIYQSNLQLND